MTRILKISLIFVLALSLNNVNAQRKAKNAVISFKQKVIELGKFKEEEGPKTVKYEFKNNGSVPILIRNVNASCGCTTPTWSKEPIPPKAKGFIEVKFDPKNRPGGFEKSISVYANTQPAYTVLKLKGRVIPREKTPAERFPTNYFGLRMRSSSIPFTRVKNNQTKRSQIAIYNDSKEDIKLEFDNYRKYIKIKMEPEVLKPKQKGFIVASFDASVKNQFGASYDYIRANINGDENKRVRFLCTASVVEDFSKLTPEQRINAPKVRFNTKTVDFGEAIAGEKKTVEFIIENRGKDDLFIRRIRPTCGCTSLAPTKKVLKSGESIPLKVVFDTRGKRGRVNKTIYVTTNDPSNPTSILRLVGNVRLAKK
ncbi:MAG: DUF1573 domain-containing protein [Marinifilaceae bacterium]|jgi:hypothetical protein|nr:DUF1573 domain-containing protein [Marinifilaceae bacterium]